MNRYDAAVDCRGWTVRLSLFVKHLSSHIIIMHA
jgi:hypothetical protein